MATKTDTNWVGKKFSRKEDHRLITGKGKYLADLSMPGMLHIVFVRSEHAHARIKSIDVSAARKLPGVVMVVTGEDIKNKIKSMPQPVVQPALVAKYPRHWPLAVGKVKFHGEPIAAVVARDKYVAEDAAELVRAEYDPLPYIGDPEKALVDKKNRVHEEWDDNVIFEN
ncbi:MAG: xanthine dehydrogenase family protein molybdopterin-binding subunit, partial [Alphaproteobacteria bacterium]|nr:xanthine dehydrogenase family protein molybdopterin-binding subunit [Alphaproteobacteria bacterium]